MISIQSYSKQRPLEGPISLYIMHTDYIYIYMYRKKQWQVYHVHWLSHKRQQNYKKC